MLKRVQYDVLLRIIFTFHAKHKIKKLPDFNLILKVSNVRDNINVHQLSIRNILQNQQFLSAFEPTN